MTTMAACPGGYVSNSTMHCEVWPHAEVFGIPVAVAAAFLAGVWLYDRLLARKRGRRDQGRGENGA